MTNVPRVPENPPAPAARVESRPPSPAIVPPVFAAAYLENPAPVYPALSRRMGESGRVLLRVRVTASGRAETVEVHASSGSSRLDAAAHAAVMRWRFEPARRGTEAVADWVLIPISFRLEKQT